MSGDAIEVEGVVRGGHRGDVYVVNVVLAGATRRALARRSGHLVRHFIRLIEGDRVRVELSPYDLTRGRITRRLPAHQGAA